MALSKELDPKGTCTASKKYQDIKLNDLESNRPNLTDKQYEKSKKNITDKSCLCIGLVNSAYLEHGLPVKGQKQGVVICPGPNLSFFNKEVSLSEMVRHIYGYENILPDDRRPHLFINELKLYVDYFRNEIAEFSEEITKSQVKKWESFKGNLLKGISYYEDLFDNTNYFKSKLEGIFSELRSYKSKIDQIKIPQL